MIEQQLYTHSELEEMMPNSIHDRTELFDTMPVIHRLASIRTADPHVPILCERNLEIELSCRLSAHMIENNTLTSFPGITADEIQEMIQLTQHRDRLISDIDGKGNIHTNEPPFSPDHTNLRPVIDYFLNQKLINQ